MAELFQSVTVTCEQQVFHKEDRPLVGRVGPVFNMLEVTIKAMVPVGLLSFLIISLIWHLVVLTFYE